MQLEQAIEYVGGNYGPSKGELLNIVFRSILHFAAVVACLVPMQLFCRNGELAGATLVISGALMNLYHFTNTLTWHNDDIANWPRGYGWCDIQLATTVPLETLVAASTCAILRNVAIQISSLRATTLTGSEKRRKNLAHALIMFPVPLLQVILYFFVISMRYNISGIIGCQAMFQTNWVFVTFFLLPCPIFSLCAGYYAGKPLPQCFQPWILLTCGHPQSSHGGGTNRLTSSRKRACGTLATPALGPETRGHGESSTS